MIGSEKIVLMYNNAMRTFGSKYNYHWIIGAALVEAWKDELKVDPLIGLELYPEKMNLMGLPVYVDYERRYVIALCISTDF